MLIFILCQILDRKQRFWVMTKDRVLVYRTIRNRDIEIYQLFPPKRSMSAGVKCDSCPIR
ncbi:hypothetical protein PHYBLDRAFT_157965 [Phycomyces blakesleeanus NRRL 1555(-)]|uniref:Uncharacterized protein n=1 Tax=Phycomyces blakesleeanus (strain ATCC 8743b / DSM 1359 / FGSC 10004 / NBRC 33097 / NRRL 1555) TaxID=763407 RepID=A0A167NUD7_PHYB8|nr:hypothetical protein PHYBLDRAFT_157965 [Phycomyces blakesleeanus NRRL 1555(-)]OAD76626.1 hypothetical protein PHYBLDRAFT_157965 [Phycomyces blakesleeanus NRRL 1555(-)]|eukprot:XP_018294666.1 hypothetical protein PHYBLDRAFT_157965 [Phycomyces blakesleeanus NRRL 1555(-)]